MKKVSITIMAFLLVFILLFGWQAGFSYAAPPIRSEAGDNEAAEAEKEEKKEKTPEEKKNEKEERDFKRDLGRLRKRQANDEKQIRVRANIFPSIPPDVECTGADRARSRLENVTGEGGVVILGDVIIDSKNEANVEHNKGSIDNDVNVSIINQVDKRC